MADPGDSLRTAAAALALAARRNEARWEPALSRVRTASCIWVSGVGKSAFVAKKLAATLTSFHRRAAWLHPVEAFHGDAGSVQPDDALVAVSASGRTAELLRLARELRIPVVALTDPTSPLGGMADACLDVRVEAEAGGDAPVTAFVVAAAVADALALCLREGHSLHHPGGFLGLSRRVVRDVMLPPPMVAPDAPLAACIPLLGHGAVLVQGGGLFTDGDLRRAVGGDAGALARAVGEVCTRAPVTVLAGASCAQALALMEDRPSQLSVLPVVDEQGAYVGLLRLHDLVRLGIGA